MAESEEELKSLLMKVKEESEKVGLKVNIQKMKIMASGPITSCEIDGETVETVSDFIFWGSKITADGDYSHETKRRSLLERKVMTNLNSTLKSRDITSPTKVCLVKAMVFPVVMYGCESWTVKKTERQKINADGDCSQEIKRCLLLGRKLMTNLDSIFKSRDITLPTKVCLVKTMVFPVFMYGCESWTIKKAEHRRINAFALWCWRRLLDCKQIQPVHSEGDRPWDFFGRNDAKAETPVLWPPHEKS